MLLAARIITSLNHGAFFGVGSVVAASLVPENRRATAVATMFSGLAIANIGGVPLATWVGAVIGWRTAFWGMAALGVVTMASLSFALRGEKERQVRSMLAELTVFRRPAVLYALMITVLASSAFFTVFTYIAPILRDEANASPKQITGMLVLFGVALTVGNWLGGRFADRSVDGTLIVILAAITVALGTFAFTMHSLALASLSMAVWGAATFSGGTPLQIRVMTAAAEAPNLASSVNIGAFNLGNAIGAAAGGIVIALGLNYSIVCLSGALFSAAGLIVVLATPARRYSSPTLAP
jgi:DHA1 family inner membrane transport protein